MSIGTPGIAPKDNRRANVVRAIYGGITNNTGITTEMLLAKKVSVFVVAILSNSRNLQVRDIEWIASLDVWAILQLRISKSQEKSTIEIHKFTETDTDDAVGSIKIVSSDGSIKTLRFTKSMILDVKFDNNRFDGKIE